METTHIHSHVHDDMGDHPKHSPLSIGCQHAHDDEERRVDLKILACLAGGMLLMAAVAAHFLFRAPGAPLFGESAPQAGFIGLLAAILLGAPIILEAARGLLSPKHAHSHMDELIALAVIASIASGSYIEAGFVAFFMLIASFIEHRTAVGALKTIESLIRITPTRAQRLTEDGTEQEVAAHDLRPGDIVIVRPGDNIPGDGTVRAGQSSVNQANITGESLPVDRGPGDEVYSGTINETGRLEITISRAGEDSTLGQVQRLILQAAQTKPVAARMLEKYAQYYTPTVLMIAGIVYMFTKDLYICISLLLIACPCAIVLAGPTAVVAALSAAARLGVLVKNVTDLEIARRITAIVFDKTGTLTTGKLAVTRMQPAPGTDGADLLRLAAVAERESKHPVARAVVEMATRAKLTLEEPSEFEEVAGRGVAARLDSGEVLVGRETWLRERGVDLSDVDLEAAEKEGLSLLIVAHRGRGIGWIGLADTTRESSRPAMDELAELGVNRRVMITGDRAEPAARVARTVHVTDVQSEALPGDKLDLVESLKKQGHTVAVVGDGVNDGPALAAGDISIAMGAAGSDVAIHSASIALMNSNLNRIPFLVRLSRATVSTIRQNLAGVLLYVLGMLVLLSLGWMTPLIAAIGHGLSSIIVVFNSARLVRQGESLEGTGTPIPSRAEPATPPARFTTAVPA